MCAAGQVVQLECVSSWVLSTHRKEGTSFVPLEAPIPYLSIPYISRMKSGCWAVKVVTSLCFLLQPQAVLSLAAA